MPKHIREDALIGRTSGRLTVTATWIDPEDHTRWVIADCSCGTKGHVLRYGNFSNNRSKSCGCAIREQARKLGLSQRTHGQSLTPTYVLWHVLRRRAGVAGKWATFEGFLEDVKQRPKGKLPLRKDITLPFSPENLEGWGKREQSGKLLITIRGVTRTMSAWAREIGISRQCFHQWLVMDVKGNAPRSQQEIEEYIFNHAGFMRRSHKRRGLKRRGMTYKKRTVFSGIV